MLESFPILWSRYARSKARFDSKNASCSPQPIFIHTKAAMRRHYTIISVNMQILFMCTSYSYDYSLGSQTVCLHKTTYQTLFRGLLVFTRVQKEVSLRQTIPKLLQVDSPHHTAVWYSISPQVHINTAHIMSSSVILSALKLNIKVKSFYFPLVFPFALEGEKTIQTAPEQRLHSHNRSRKACKHIYPDMTLIWQKDKMTNKQGLFWIDPYITISSNRSF